MAQNKNAPDLDADMELALQEALENDLTSGDTGDMADVDLDSELSLDDFEAQVSKAAGELSEANQPVEPAVAVAAAAGTTAAAATASWPMCPWPAWAGRRTWRRPCPFCSTRAAAS